MKAQYGDWGELYLSDINILGYENPTDKISLPNVDIGCFDHHCKFLKYNPFKVPQEINGSSLVFNTHGNIPQNATAANLYVKERPYGSDAPLSLNHL